MLEKIFLKNTGKGEFYFFKKESRKIKVSDLLEKNLSEILAKIAWNKSMKWANYDLYWGRPLKSILAIFNKKPLNFVFNHINSSNKTFIDKSIEEGIKIFKDFNSYSKFFRQKGILIDQDLRKKIINNKINEIINKKNLEIKQNDSLIDEIVNIVEKPVVIVCDFDKKFLNVPSEILITTMQTHQKYLPTFDKKNNLTNNFFVVSDIKDIKGFVKLGNERVIEARLSDAEFFWEKNKTQNLVKQVDKLKNINYFKGLGSYFDKIQRMRKLSSLISDDFLINKDKN
jgi:Glycyl-tRNA synthetase, beta subunit